MPTLRTRDLVKDLRRIVGSRGVRSEPGELLVFESDALTLYRGTPLAVVFPESAAQVVRLCRYLHKRDVPFVPRGAGTGLSGGAVADGAVVIECSRMNRVLEIDPVDRRARVEPGVPNHALGEAAAVYGLMYAPDPSSQVACTIGGNIAENSGGPHCLKYGVTLNHVLGLRVVLPDGELVDLTGPESAGYDLVGLFVGSEGTFGIAVEIELRLVPLPEATATLLAHFDDVRNASRAVSTIIAAGIVPAALEMVDQATIRAVEASVYAAGFPTDVAASLIVELDGPRAGLDAEAAEIEGILREHGAREVRRARGEAERTRFWQARKKAFGAMGRLAPDLLVQDATVPRSKLPDVLDRIYEIARRYDLLVTNVFHAGDGNLHPNIPFDRRNSEEVERVHAASKEIMGVCVAAGGTITGEHGVGLDKRDYMNMIYSGDDLACMAAIRRVWDPKGLCNPGKVLPT